MLAPIMASERKKEKDNGDPSSRVKKTYTTQKFMAMTTRRREHDDDVR